MVFEVILLKFNSSLGHSLEYHTETIQMFQEENDGITSSSKNKPMNKRSSNWVGTGTEFQDFAVPHSSSSP